MLRILLVAYIVRILRVCYASSLRMICIFFAYVTHNPCVWYSYSSRMLCVFFACIMHHPCVWYAYPRVCYACSSRILRPLSYVSAPGGELYSHSLQFFDKMFLRCTFEMLIRTLHEAYCTCIYYFRKYYNLISTFWLVPQAVFREDLLYEYFSTEQYTGQPCNIFNLYFYSYLRSTSRFYTDLILYLLARCKVMEVFSSFIHQQSFIYFFHNFFYVVYKKNVRS